MAGYTEKRAAVLDRIGQLETDQKTFTDPAKLARVRVKLAQTKELLARVEAKQAAGNGSPPKAKAAKAAGRKRAKR